MITLHFFCFVAEFKGSQKLIPAVAVQCSMVLCGAACDLEEHGGQGSAGQGGGDGG